MPRYCHPIILLALLMSAEWSYGLIRQRLEEKEAPEWLAMRAKPLKRHLVDPIGPTSSIYASIVRVGGINYRVIVDTGSGTLFLIGRNCTKESGSGCDYTTNFYAGSGSTFPYNGNQCGAGNSINYNTDVGVCRLTATYADGSFVQAVGRIEQSVLGDWGGQMKFGEAYYTSDGFILTGSDGIWGMARPNEQYVSVPGPLSAALDDGMPPVFAFCFNGNGGELHLGGYDASFGADNHWYSYNTDAYHYQLALSGFSVENAAVSGTDLDVIFDTGSTISYFPDPLFSNILDAIETACPTLCNTEVFSGSEVTTTPSAWPDIQITFTDTSGTEQTITLTGSQYLRQVSVTQYTGGFQANLNEFALFGLSFMRHWYTVFDIGNNRLGIGQLQSGQCTAQLPPTAPLTQISPGSPQPPNVPVAWPPAPSTPYSVSPSSIPSSNADPSSLDPSSRASRLTIESHFLPLFLATFALLLTL